jgi:hypothetical protein
MLLTETGMKSTCHHAELFCCVVSETVFLPGLALNFELLDLPIYQVARIIGMNPCAGLEGSF